MTEYIVNLPKPHEKQAEIRASAARRRVICAGRRCGKTTIVALMAVESMLAGRRILEAAPTADQTNVFWERCKRAMVELIAAGYVYKNETERILEMPGGAGRIRTKTAWDADSLRGDYADLLILDEYSLMNPNAWDEVGAPMLLDNDGDAIFIFTPKRKNHAFHTYVRAQSDTTGRWAAWHGTSYDNPYLSQEALAEITADMTEEAYRQEIMAEFLDNEGAVFRNLAANMTAELTEPLAHKGHKMVLGVDWGKYQDFTAISVICANCRQEVAKDRFNVVDYVLQRQRLVSLARKWGVTIVIPESNSMGEPIIEELRRDAAIGNAAIRPFATTSVSKPPLIESLVLAFEREECRWIDDPVWTAELEAYEVQYGGTSNRPRYGAPEGIHDDTVMARALAWYGVMLPVYEPPGVIKYA